MKFSKTSVIILLLLFAIIGAEFYYHKQQIKTEKDTLSEKNSISTPQEKNTTKRDSLSSRAPDIANEKEDLLTDEKIISTVTAYQKGYKDGCQKASETNTTITERVESHYERAYLLGFKKGKTECLLQIKQKKERYDLGYRDGCNSAVSKLVKDTALYQSSTDYKKGWERGAQQCSKKRENAVAKKPIGKVKKVNKKSPDYQNGYRHGCTTAKGNYTRHEDTYLRSRAYRQGWTLGRQKCKRTKKSLSPAQKRHYFDQGYRDGCDSARGFYRRDHYKYKSIMSYKEGWRAGEFECSGY